MRIELTLELYEVGCRIRKDLERLYPNCFFSIGSEKPLKIGIMEDLLKIREELKIEPMPSEDELMTSILIYTGSLSYRAGLIRDGSVRIDLDGNVVDEVTDDQRLIAKNRPLAPLWKLTSEEVDILKKREEEAKKLRRERYLSYNTPQKSEVSDIPTEQSIPLKDESEDENTAVEKQLKESEPEIVNPNLFRPKLTLNKKLEQ